MSVASGVRSPAFPAGHGGTARGENDHIVLNQFFHQDEVWVVMGHTGIVAADHTGNPSNPTIDDIVIQGSIGGTENTAQ